MKSVEKSPRLSCLNCTPVTKTAQNGKDYSMELTQLLTLEDGLREAVKRANL